jgi:hypothetical protein
MVTVTAQFRCSYLRVASPPLPHISVSQADPRLALPFLPDLPVLGPVH